MLKEAVERLKAGESLDFEISQKLFDVIFDGDADDNLLAELLLLLANKGESKEEIAGAVSSLMRHAIRVETSKGVIDTCGTGGDGKNTFNISTAAAIVCSLFVPVAKHGNRAISSKSGSFDLLKALGIPAELERKEAEDYLEKHDFVFLFAPNFHPAMRHVANVRKKLARRTIFNLIGPLANPSNPYGQLIGVFSVEFLPVMFDASSMLGMDNVAFVSSFDGLDEISPSAPTKCFIRRNGVEEMFVFEPSDLDIYVSFDEIKGGDAAFNAAMLEEAFSNEREGLARIIALNAAFSLYVAGVEDSIFDAYKLAFDSIKSGRAKEKLESLRGA